MSIPFPICKGAPPAMNAQSRARLLVFHLTNWTWAERLRMLQRRDLTCDQTMTVREGRIARRELAAWLADAVARINPMILDGTFERMERENHERRFPAPIDLIIDHAHYRPTFDNRGNVLPIAFPALFRTKEPWGFSTPFAELVPREWEGIQLESVPNQI